MTKKDADIRDTILFGEKYDEEKYPGGIRRFGLQHEGVTKDQLSELVDKGMASMDTAHNGFCIPPPKQRRDFCAKLRKTRRKSSIYFLGTILRADGFAVCLRNPLYHIKCEVDKI